MEWTVAFWHDGLTNNYLSMEFDRDDVQYLLNYLNLVTGNADKNSQMISNMIKKGIICDQI